MARSGRTDVFGSMRNEVGPEVVDDSFLFPAAPAFTIKSRYKDQPILKTPAARDVSSAFNYVSHSSAKSQTISEHYYNRLWDFDQKEAREVRIKGKFHQLDLRR